MTKISLTLATLALSFVASQAGEPPVVTPPPFINGTEDQPIPIGNIQVSDPDSPWITFELLSLSAGTFTVTDFGLLDEIRDNGTTRVVLVGSPFHVFVTLTSLVYVPGPDNTFEVIRYSAHDEEFNSGFGTSILDLTPVNDAPRVFPAPATTVAADQRTLLAENFVVNDVDDGNVSIVLTAPDGILELRVFTPTVQIDGNETSTLMISGPVEEFAVRLGALYYTPTLGFVGSTSIDIVASDGEDEAADTLPLFVESVTGAPDQIESLPWSAIKARHR